MVLGARRATRPPQLSAFTFITPLVGVFAGWLVFGETITGGFALAIALVRGRGLRSVNWPRRGGFADEV